MTKKDLHEQFKKEINNTWKCGTCGYIKYENCCPEEGDCIIKNKYVEWLENKIIGENYELRDSYSRYQKLY
jgi:hypothetical protein